MTDVHTQPRPSFFASRALAGIALALWAVSLTQPVFIFTYRGKPDIVNGIKTLLTGWIALLDTLGWYANVPFLFSAVWVLLVPIRSRIPWIFTTLSVLLALDTFRFIVLAGNGNLIVHACGPGMALWFAAIGVLALAVAWRSAEHRGRASPLAALGSPIVLLMLAVLAGALAFYRAQVRETIHNDSDSASVNLVKYLPAGSVRIGPVCKIAVTPPATQIALNGPLEIKGHVSPLDSPDNLLALGIPTVRKNGFDFALLDPNDINSIYWQPAAGPAGATLTLSESVDKRGHLNAFEATLTSADGRVTAFHQLWIPNNRTPTGFCPDYNYSGDAGLLPASLVPVAISVPHGLKPPASRNVRTTIAPVKVSNATVRALNGQALADAGANGHCPPGVGLTNNERRQYDLSYSSYAGTQVFGIGERRYLIGNNQPLSAICTKDSIYLYYFWIDARKTATLYLQRRRLDDFRKIWTARTEINDELFGSLKDARSVRINDLHEEASQIALDILNPAEARGVEVAFPAPAR